MLLIIQRVFAYFSFQTEIISLNREKFAENFFQYKNLYFSQGVCFYYTLRAFLNHSIVIDLLLNQVKLARNVKDK